MDTLDDILERYGIGLTGINSEYPDKKRFISRSYDEIFYYLERKSIKPTASNFLKHGIMLSTPFGYRVCIICLNTYVNAFSIESDISKFHPLLFPILCPAFRYAEDNDTQELLMFFKYVSLVKELEDDILKVVSFFSPSFALESLFHPDQNQLLREKVDLMYLALGDLGTASRGTDLSVFANEVYSYFKSKTD